MNTEAGDRWRTALAEWAIPSEILEQAPEDPYIHPPINFTVPDFIAETPSHIKARELLVEGGSVLDIGCGGGIAAMACVPPASHLIGVDHQPEMLTMFAENAEARGATSQVFEGFWPAISPTVPSADVVTAYHVVYNVPQIEEFLLGMDSHSAKRVVIEMPQRHPQSNASAYWSHFWSVTRPQTPSHVELLEVLKSIGINARCELWEGAMGRDIDPDLEARFMRIRLCLPEEREAEVREFMATQKKVTHRALATIWWDK